VTVIGFHHTGRTVEDMDRALRIYRDVLGLEVVDDAVVDDPGLAQSLGLPDAAARVVLLGAGGKPPFLELFEYDRPVSAPRPVAAAVTDIGDTHPCLLVDDIHATCAALVEAGLEFASEPQQLHGGPVDGQWVVLGTDLDGAPLELWSLGS
jgi:catechol 2,3-dioxygenase-like lactoylglutathione lyase family enzyme